MPDDCGHAEQALGDADLDARSDAVAVSFEVELAFEGVVDRVGPLADPADRAVAGNLVAAAGRTRSAEGGGEQVFEVAPGEALVADEDQPGRAVPTRRAWASNSAATSRSPMPGLAGHQAVGIPPGLVARYSFRPQYQRECAAQYS